MRSPRSGRRSSADADRPGQIGRGCRSPHSSIASEPPRVQRILRTGGHRRPRPRLQRVRWLGHEHLAVAHVVGSEHLRRQGVAATVTDAGRLVEGDPHAGAPDATCGAVAGSNSKGNAAISRIPGE